ncbi:MAG TPA: glycosyltransferase family 39 protein [Candidatus Didemnitutus sp.]|nr:glycosyltransferase family 39 protein [Candidatus Didemnitutus sp.]
MTSRQHTVIATVLVIIGLYVMRLTSAEIQPSPEGLIAVGGEHIVLFDEWKVSSTAPLTTWASAVGVRVFGATPLAVRWFAIICVLVTLVMTYLVARRSLNFQNSILAIVVVGTSIPFITYGRQATDVIPFVACIMLAVWAVVKLRDTLSSSTRLGVAALLVLGLAGSALSSPITAVLYGGSPVDSSGPLEVPLLLVEASPFLAGALLWCVVMTYRREYIPTWLQPDVLVLTVWFLAGLVILAVVPTRSSLTVAYIIVPATILALRATEQFRESRRMGLIIAFYGVVSMASLWFVLSGLLHLPPTQMLLFLVAAAGCGVGLAGVLIMRSQKRRATMAVVLFRPVIFGAIGLAALGSVLVVMKGSPTVITGGRAVASALHEDTLAVHSFTYLYHAQRDADAFNGQLAWYTNGWMTGWRPGYRYVLKAMPQNTVDEYVVRSVRGASWIVYYHPNVTVDEQKLVRRLLIDQYSAHVETPHYTLYRNR